MRTRRVKRLVVTDETGHPLGIVSRIDVLSFCDREDDEIRNEIIGDIIIGDFALNPDAFEVLVRCGIVTITGQAESRAVAVQLLDASGCPRLEAKSSSVGRRLSRSSGGAASGLLAGVTSWMAVPGRRAAFPGGWPAFPRSVE